MLIGLGLIAFGYRQNVRKTVIKNGYSAEAGEGGEAWEASKVKGSVSSGVTEVGAWLPCYASRRLSPVEQG